MLLRVWGQLFVPDWPVMMQIAATLFHQVQGPLLTLPLKGVLLRLKEARSRLQGGSELLRRACSVPPM